MNSLFNPNVAYVLLVFGFMTAILAFFSPGTGLLELGAVFALVTGLYISANLPAHGWAFVILTASLIPGVLSVRSRSQRRRWIFITGTFLTFLVGSTFLFDFTSSGPAVHPALLLFMAILSTSLNWFLASRSLEAIRRPRTFDLDHLVGMVGRAATDIHTEGSVYVNGENWTASSRDLIRAGSKVRVCERDGILIKVEPVVKENLTHPPVP